MEFLEISEDQKEKYQDFVHAHGPFLQDYAWGEFRKKLHHEVYRFAIVDGGELHFTAQVLKNNFRGKSYLFSEYGPVCSKPVRENPELFARYLEFFCKNVCDKFKNLIFFRLEPSWSVQLVSQKSGMILKSQDINPHQTLALDLAKNVEDLQLEMHQKTRYNIKIGQKNNIEVKVAQEFGQAILPFDQTAARSRVHFFTQDYYEKLLSFFSDEKSALFARMYAAYHQEDLLAANIMLYYNKTTAIYLHGASGNEKRQLKGPHVLQWQAILDAKSAGFAEYDFYGVELDPNHAWAGLSRFKLGFGGTVKTYAGTHDFIFSKPWYNIYKGLRKLNRIIRKS